MARVLIVDDEPDALFLFKVIFENAGYDVDAAPHGQAALERIAEQLPDLVVTDLMMPVMDGSQLIASLRADPRTAAIPILLVSAAPISATGADAVLPKPFRSQQILEMAESLLEAS